MKINQGTHIFNIDGTIVKHHTNEWILGAKDYITKLYNEGYRIILMTSRNLRDKDEVWSVENTTNTILKELDELGVEYIVLFDVPMDRTTHDTKIITDERKINEPFGGRILNGNKYVDLWSKGQPIDYKNII